MEKKKEKVFYLLRSPHSPSHLSGDMTRNKRTKASRALPFAVLSHDRHGFHAVCDPSGARLGSFAAAHLAEEARARNCCFASRGASLCTRTASGQCSPFSGFAPPLPHDVLASIFSRLDGVVAHVCACACVCRGWSAAAASQCAWSRGRLSLRNARGLTDARLARLVARFEGGGGGEPALRFLDLSCAGAEGRREDASIRVGRVGIPLSDAGLAAALRGRAHSLEEARFIGCEGLTVDGICEALRSCRLTRLCVDGVAQRAERIPHRPATSRFVNGGPHPRRRAAGGDSARAARGRAA